MTRVGERFVVGTKSTLSESGMLASEAVWPDDPATFFEGFCPNCRVPLAGSFRNWCPRCRAYWNAPVKVN